MKNQINVNEISDKDIDKQQLLKHAVSFGFRTAANGVSLLFRSLNNGGELKFTKSDILKMGLSTITGALLIVDDVMYEGKINEKINLERIDTAGLLASSSDSICDALNIYGINSADRNKQGRDVQQTQAGESIARAVGVVGHILTPMITNVVDEKDRLRRLFTFTGIVVKPLENIIKDPKNAKLYNMFIDIKNFSLTTLSSNSMKEWIADGVKNGNKLATNLEAFNSMEKANSYNNQNFFNNNNNYNYNNSMYRNDGPNDGWR